jgi:hypothetical protein
MHLRRRPARHVLPGHNLSTHDKDVVRLGTGLIGTIAARADRLGEGLLRHAEHSSHADDEQCCSARQSAGAVRTGDERRTQSVTARHRCFGRSNVAREKFRGCQGEPPRANAASDAFFAKLQQLSLQNDSQRSLQARAIQIATDIAQTRLLTLRSASPSRISLPRKGCRVGLRIVLFEACSAFTHVTACTLALSPIRDTLIEGFSHFVTSMTAPIASGWSGCRVGLAPTGKRRLCTAHTQLGHRPDRAICHFSRVEGAHPKNMRKGRTRLTARDHRTHVLRWSPSDRCQSCESIGSSFHNLATSRLRKPVSGSSR